MMENCFYCGKGILTDCDEYVILAKPNKNGDIDYLLYCVDCTETVKQLKSEHKQLLDALIESNKIYSYLLLKYEKEEFDPTMHVAIPKHNKYLNTLIEQITKKKWSEI